MEACWYVIKAGNTIIQCIMFLWLTLLISLGSVKKSVFFLLDQTLLSPYPMTKRKKWYGHARLAAILLIDQFLPMTDCYDHPWT